MTSGIERINPPALPDPSAFGYSQVSVVESGRITDISGQVAWWRDGQAVPVNVSDQMKVATENAKTHCRRSGRGLRTSRSRMTDLTPERLGTVLPMLGAFFDGASPGPTGIGVAALAAPDLQVELERVVRLPG